MIEDHVTRFDFGTVLSRGVAYWARNAAPYTLLTAVVYLPLLLYVGFGVDLATLAGADLERFQLHAIIMAIGTVVLRFAATGAITYGVIQQLRGERPTLGKCAGVGLSTLLPVLGVAILSGLAIGVGLLLFIIPGAMAACMLYVAVPVAVIERPGVIASLSRSYDLSLGYRWHIFGLVALFFGANQVISRVLDSSLLQSATSLSQIRTYLYLVVAADLFLASVGAAVTAVCYHDLRVTVDPAVDADELAQVFD